MHKISSVVCSVCLKVMSHRAIQDIYTCVCDVLSFFGLLPEASCLPGRLLTPYVCDHKTLAEARISSDDLEFTTVATLVSWDTTSSPVQLHRILDLERGGGGTLCMCVEI